MFLLVTSAIAGTLIGWPCQRLNWGWRNVWTTCSIYSWAPGSNNDAPHEIPTGFRRSNAATAWVPVNSINTGGWYQPAATVGNAAAATVPAYFCAQAPATGTGATAALRNRCRRAVDAYGALVAACGRPNALAGNRGPNAVSPDYAPSGGHQPHVTNVQGLTHAAAFCSLAPWTQTAGATPAALSTPATQCPGLLGWFTVVFNACGFTNAPGLGPNGVAPYTVTYFPLGNVASASVLATAVNGAGAANTGTAGYFCGTGAGATGVPSAWNGNGATFRTSRCRKALDQFGRTASRCHFSLAATAPGPAQAGGYSDPLRVLAVGTSTANAPVTPNGLNIWAPACNV